MGLSHGALAIEGVEDPSENIQVRLEGLPSAHGETLDVLQPHEDTQLRSTAAFSSELPVGRTKAETTIGTKDEAAISRRDASDGETCIVFLHGSAFLPNGINVAI